MRPIDADLMVATCKEIVKHEWNKKCAPVSWSDAYEGFIDTIEEMPTMDAVEVVRCGKCKNWARHTMVNLDYGVCYRFHCKKNENGFCELGERKTE